MKVALISSFIHPICEPFSGGTESFLSHFAQGLVRQGVEVVCYACAGSAIPGVEMRHCGVAKGALAYTGTADELGGEAVLAIRAAEDSAFYRAFDDIRHDPSIDLVHNHSFSGIPFFLAPFFPLPMVHTLHLPPILPNMMEALRFASHRPQQSGTLVAISRYQAQLWQPYYPITQVIYNGPATTTEAFPGSPHHDGTLIFVGRMDPSKGVEDAIQVATDLGKILSIYGAPQPVNTTYFENTIQPLLKTAANVRYCGLVDQQTLFQALSRAQALLLPIKWDEPSGNVVLEAISCGTPAVMYNRGSAHEVIKHGVSGYVVPPDDLLAFATAVEQTETLDRMACASYAHLHFSQERCVQQYIDLFQSLAPEA